MDKKYRTVDKKVITNCLSAIPTSVERDCHRKNIRDENRQYSRVLISSPPVLKAYNYCMGAVDRHDRLLGQHSIPLTTSHGYMKVFYHLLDSAVVNAWILYKTSKQAKGEWNMAAQRRHTLAWFKECVILSLCGKYTSRRRTPFGSGKQTIIPQVGHSLQAIARHHVQSMVNIPAFQDKPEQARCSMCHQPKRTACIEFLQLYCYDCGRQHLEQLLLQHSLQNTAPNRKRNRPTHHLLSLIPPHLQFSLRTIVTVTVTVMIIVPAMVTFQFDSRHFQISIALDKYTCILL